MPVPPDAKGTPSVTAGRKANGSPLRRSRPGCVGTAGRARHRVDPERRLPPLESLRTERTISKEVWARPQGHVRNFLDCVKSRQQPAANVEVAHRAASVCHIANITVKLGRKLRWDPAKESFVGDEQANRLRSEALREPWRL